MMLIGQAKLSQSLFIVQVNQSITWVFVRKKNNKKMAEILDI